MSWAEIGLLGRWALILLMLGSVFFLGSLYGYTQGKKYE